MTLSLLRFGSVVVVAAFAAGAVTAAPPAHTTVRPGVSGGAYRPYNSGPRVVIGVGIGTGYGMYGPGYNSFSAYGVPYSNGYGSLGYGYPSGFRGSNYGSLGVPAIPGAYYSPAPSYQVLPAQPFDPNPTPLPLPLPSGEPAPATITVIASDGAKVSFDGIETDQTGTRHSFTTKPIAPGAETRVSVKVNGPGGPATLSIGVRAGEKATVDMRK